MKYKDNKIVYEVGDWVTSEDSGFTDYGEKTPTDQIIDIDEAGWLGFKGRKLESNTGINHWFPRIFRPATQKEIDEALGNEKIFIGDHEVKFYGHHIKVGCQNVSKETFLKIGKKAGWLL